MFIGAKITRAVHDSVFWLSLRNTLYFAALVIRHRCFFARPAMLLNVNIPAKHLSRDHLFMPSLVPHRLGDDQLWMFNGQYGMINVFWEDWPHRSSMAGRSEMGFARWP
jgi:ABC-type sugar transport system permease subunit